MPQPAPPHDSSTPSGTGARIAAALGLGALALPLGWMAYSALAVDHYVPLPDAVGGERRAFRSARAGRLAYYASERGEGRPVVLVHSINAAASSAEMRPLFERLVGRRPVYALDLPGYGFSERTDRSYTPDLFAHAIADFLATELVEEGPCDIVALSLGCELAARAALERPELVNSLAFLSPTGFSSPQRPLEKMGAGSGATRVHRALANPIWAQPLYDLLASQPSVRYFLGQYFAGPVDEHLVEYGWRTAHQPGARHAPLHFLSGQLFTPDAQSALYDRLGMPVLVLYDRDPMINFGRLPDTLARRANWRALRIEDTNGLPHFDQPAATLRALEVFWLGGVDGESGGAATDATGTAAERRG